ncbi:AraC family transcriptional regulator [Thiomicrospira microaerophila]|uniref:AraC family transcriptional regulator n=1 Tax=Thiomicrospira microaerophila TaxID=406020 RepID=UPI001E5B3A5C|nr:AraC family transcriptional regulator [Thiomicrospira microaerophila]
MNAKTYNICQEFYAACYTLDVDSEPVLNAIGISTHGEKLNSLYITALQISKLFEALVVRYGKDDFHIKLADGFSKAAFGHAFLALQCSENLVSGVHRVARFKEIIEPVRWHITETQDRLSIELQSLSEDFPLYGIAQIMSFLWLVKSCRNVSARKVVPQKVTLTDPAPHQLEIEQEMGCKIEIGDKPVIEFMLVDLAHPVLSVNRFVTSGLEAGVAKADMHQAEDISLVNAVYQIVNELLPSGVITSERVAQRMALGKRTLERRLSDQGVRFSDIVRSCRKDMARHYLHNTQLAMHEITLLLGFRETNSFYRAFKDWFDCTPIDFRSQR